MHSAVHTGWKCREYLKSRGHAFFFFFPTLVTAERKKKYALAHCDLQSKTRVSQMMYVDKEKTCFFFFYTL